MGKSGPLKMKYLQLNLRLSADVEFPMRSWSGLSIASQEVEGPDLPRCLFSKPVLDQALKITELDLLSDHTSKSAD
jgi:hypothetical protein